jgi:hypothetical protein
MSIEEVINSGLDQETLGNIVNELKTKWGEDKITVGTIHLVLKEGMELVDKLDCPGSQKKEHVITIVKAVVVDLVDDENDERIILELIDKKILENTMDLIIMASKGQLNLNNKETQKKIMSCGRSFIPILISIVKRIISIVRESKQSKRNKAAAAATVAIASTLSTNTVPADTPDTPETNI